MDADMRYFGWLCCAGCRRHIWKSNNDGNVLVCAWLIGAFAVDGGLSDANCKLNRISVIVWGCMFSSKGDCNLCLEWRWPIVFDWMLLTDCILTDRTLLPLLYMLILLLWFRMCFDDVFWADCPQKIWNVDDERLFYLLRMLFLLWTAEFLSNEHKFSKLFIIIELLILLIWVVLVCFWGTLVSRKKASVCIYL